MEIQFTSVLAREIQDFLEFKRARGYKYGVREEYRLRSFDQFVAEHCPNRRRPRLEDLVPKWLARTEGHHPRTIRWEFSVARQFCLFLRRCRPESYVPDRGLAPPNANSRFLPYIFSKQQIRLLLHETKGLKKPPYRAVTFHTMVVVLYCTGLRPGEAVRLQLGDVDLETKTLFIRDSKGRSRWVPFHAPLAKKLGRYIAEREEFASRSPGSALFTQPNGRAYPMVTASAIIRTLLRRSGLKPRTGRVGPRLYDLRHSFACNVLSRWYKQGVDIHSHLPLLSAYMGHKNILGTELYLTATPELLELASRRFAARFERRELRL